MDLRCQVERLSAGNCDTAFWHGGPGFGMVKGTSTGSESQAERKGG